MAKKRSRAGYGGRDVTIVTVASLERLQAQPEWEMSVMKIGEVAEQSGVGIETIRFYER